MRVFIIFSVLIYLFFPATSGGTPSDTDTLFSLSLEEFLNVEVVSASKKSEKLFTAPATVYVITEEQIERFGFRHLQDALKYIPSVYIYNPHSWVWGGQRGLISNFSQTLLLLNGREMNNIIAQEGFISRQFATHNISRIELIASPSSALYGANALAGVINIITKDSENGFEGVSLSVEGGSFNTIAGSFLFGKTIDNVSIKASGHYFRSDEADFSTFVNDTVEFSKGWADNPLTAADYRKYRNPSAAFPFNLQIDYKGFYGGVSHYSNRESQGLEKISWNYLDGYDKREYTIFFTGMKGKLSPVTDFKVEYQHTREFMYGKYYPGFWPVSRLEAGNGAPVYAYPFPVITSEGDTLYDEGSIKRYYRSFAHYLVDQNLINDDSISNKDIHTYFTHLYTNKNSDGSRRNRIEALLTRVISSAVSIDAGYTYDLTNYSGLAITDAGIDFGATYDLPVFDSERQDQYDYCRHGFFTQLKLSLFNNALLLISGGRIDHQNHYGATFNPRVGMVFSPTETGIIKLMYGEAFREPTVFELTSNSRTEPAKLRTFEAAYARTFGNFLRLELTGYHNDVSNFLSSVSSLIGTGTGQVKKQRVTGLEFNSDLRWRSLIFFLNGAYLFDISQEVENNGRITTRNVLGVPDKKIAAGISYSLLRRLSLSILCTMTDRYEALSGNTIIMRPYTIDRQYDIGTVLSLGKAVFNDITFSGSIDINNIFNFRNFDPNVRRSGPHKFLQEGRNYFPNFICFAPNSDVATISSKFS